MCFCLCRVVAYSTVAGAEWALYRQRCAYPACNKALNESTMQRLVCCNLASYCNDSCQQADWVYHKSVCLASDKAKMEGLQHVPAATARDGCASCWKTSGSLKVCSRCRNISYCSKSCQIAHWPIHKPSCHSQLTHDKSGAGVSARDPKARIQDEFKRACGSCGKASESLKQCTRCRQVSYCNRNCQRADWPRHKSTCTNSKETNEKWEDHEDHEWCKRYLRRSCTGVHSHIILWNFPRSKRHQREKSANRIKVTERKRTSTLWIAVTQTETVISLLTYVTLNHVY